MSYQRIEPVAAQLMATCNACGAQDNWPEERMMLQLYFPNWSRILSSCGDYDLCPACSAKALDLMGIAPAEVVQ